MKKSFKRMTAFVTALVMVLAAIALVACSAKQLEAPVIKLTGNKITWDAVKNADSYDVKVGSKAAVNVKTTEYTVNETAAGEYKITVVAKSSSKKYTDSAASNEVTYTVNPLPPEPTKLGTPVLTLNENVVSWQAVSHADNYKVSVNDGAAETVTALNYTVNETDPGSYVVKVIAHSNSDEYTDSDPASITYTVEPPVVEPGEIVVTLQKEYVVVNYNDGWTVNWEGFNFADYIVVTQDNQNVDYTDLQVTAAGDSCGEDALTLTVKKDDEQKEVKLDVYFGIADFNQFKAIANKLDGWYIVTEEISEGGWTDPLGTFTGHLNGNYKKIAFSGIGGGAPSDDHALFVSNEGLIENMHLEAALQVYSGGVRVAALAGNNKGTIQNCFIKFGFVGGGNCTAGITWGADGSEASTGTIIGCVFIGEVYAEATTAYVNHAGIVGVSGTGGTKDCLYIVTPCPNTEASGHSAHGTEPADTVAVGTANANDSNNAAIDYNKLVFSSDDNQYWSSDDEATKYENNLTAQVTALVKEYLQQLTAA